MKHVAVLRALAAASVLGVAGCGGGEGAPPAPQPDIHTAQPGEPALIAVPGYDYTDVPGVSPEKAIVNSAPQVYMSASLHIVLHGGKRFAVLTLIQVKPAYTNRPSVRQDILSGLAKEMAGSGAKVTQETIHTEKVTIGRGSSIVDYAWYHGGVATAVTGGTGPDLADFVEAYLKAAHA